MFKNVCCQIREPKLQGNVPLGGCWGLQERMKVSELELCQSQTQEDQCSQVRVSILRQVG